MCLLTLAVAPVRVEGVSSPVARAAAQVGASPAPARVRAIDRALVEAADKGEHDDVVELLNAGADVNAVVEGDGSPLIAAARAGSLATVRYLLDRGADPNLAVSGDGNPLIMAAAEVTLLSPSCCWIVEHSSISWCPETRTRSFRQALEGTCRSRSCWSVAVRT
jgi:hypothetical protein